jgi:hypothetical protein
VLSLDVRKQGGFGADNAKVDLGEGPSPGRERYDLTIVMQGENQCYTMSARDIRAK